MRVEWKLPRNITPGVGAEKILPVGIKLDIEKMCESAGCFICFFIDSWEQSGHSIDGLAVL